MKDVVASILARLKNIAKENGLVYNDVLRRYATERILRRIELSPYSSQCILKGGTLFVLWRAGFDYRPTMDVDLEFRGEASAGGLVRMFRRLPRYREERPMACRSTRRRFRRRTFGKTIRMAGFA